MEEGRRSRRDEVVVRGGGHSEISRKVTQCSSAVNLWLSGAFSEMNGRQAAEAEAKRRFWSEIERRTSLASAKGEDGR